MIQVAKEKQNLRESREQGEGDRLWSDAFSEPIWLELYTPVPLHVRIILEIVSSES